MARILVAGPPLAGKSSLVRERAQPGELIFDYDTMYAALSGLDLYVRAGPIKSYVMEARNAVFALAAKQAGDSLWAITATSKVAELMRLQRLLRAQLLWLQVDEDEAHRRCTADGRPEEWHGYIGDWYRETDIVVTRRADAGGNP